MGKRYWGILESSILSIIVYNRIAFHVPCLSYISCLSDSILSIVSILFILSILSILSILYIYILYLSSHLSDRMLSYHALSCLILFCLILSHLVYLSINLISYPTCSFLFLSIQQHPCFYHSIILSTQKSLASPPTSFSSTDRDLSNCGAWRYRSSIIHSGLTV